MAKRLKKSYIPSGLCNTIQEIVPRPSTHQEAVQSLSKQECLCFLDHVGSEEYVFRIDLEEEFKILPDAIVIAKCSRAIWIF